MKKIIGIILIISLLLPTIVYAESDIQLIAGLKYGMGINEACATSKYHVVKDKGDDWIASFLKGCIGLDNTAYIGGKGTIGGYECSVMGNFDASGRLIQVMYFLGGSDSYEDYPAFFTTEKEKPEDAYTPEYEAVEEALIQQYGVGTDWKNALELTVGIPNISNRETLKYYSDHEQEFYTNQYSQRLVSQSDGTTIVISHAIIERKELRVEGELIEYDHVLAYTYYDFSVGQEEPSYSIGF